MAEEWIYEVFHWGLDEWVEVLGSRGLEARVEVGVDWYFSGG